MNYLADLFLGVYKNISTPPTPPSLDNFEIEKKRIATQQDFKVNQFSIQRILKILRKKDKKEIKELVSNSIDGLDYVDQRLDQITENISKIEYTDPKTEPYQDQNEFKIAIQKSREPKIPKAFISQLKNQQTPQKTIRNKYEGLLSEEKPLQPPPHQKTSKKKEAQYKLSDSALNQMQEKGFLTEMKKEFTANIPESIRIEFAPKIPKEKSMIETTPDKTPNQNKTIQTTLNQQPSTKSTPAKKTDTPKSTKTASPPPKQPEGKNKQEFNQKRHENVMKYIEKDQNKGVTNVSL